MQSHYINNYTLTYMLKHRQILEFLFSLSPFEFIIALATMFLLQNETESQFSVLHSSRSLRGGSSAAESSQHRLLSHRPDRSREELGGIFSSTRSDLGFQQTLSFGSELEPNKQQSKILWAIPTKTLSCVLEAVQDVIEMIFYNYSVTGSATITSEITFGKITYTETNRLHIF